MLLSEVMRIQIGRRLEELCGVVLMVKHREGVFMSLTCPGIQRKVQCSSIEDKKSMEIRE